jgi:hypothetical protein
MVLFLVGLTAMLCTDWLLRLAFKGGGAAA